MNISERTVFSYFENAIYNCDFENLVIEDDYMTVIINATPYELFWSENEDGNYRLFYYEDDVQSVITITPEDDEYENCIELVIFADTEYC